MKTKLRTLIVEDSDDDAFLLVHQIKENMIDVEFRQVETPEEMCSALMQENWDVILSDYHMPNFSGLEALAIAKELDVNIPFIIVSGTIGEELAVQAMRLGAHDYLMKNNLERLVPAIQRELKEAETRAENKLLKKKNEEAEAIKLSETKFKNLIADMHVGVLMFNSEGILLLSNNEALELLDLTEDQITGKSSIPQGWTAKNEDGTTFSGFLSIIKEISLTSQPFRNIMIEVYRPSKANSVWIMVDAVPQFNFDDEIHQIVWTFVDRTERKYAIEALRESEERYRRLVEMSPDAIVIHQDNKIVFINVAGIELIGAKTAKEILGRSMLEFVHPTWVKRVEKLLSQNLEWLPIPYTEEKYIKLDGSEVDVEVSAVPSLYHGKEAIQVIIRDISRRKKAEEEIQIKTDELTKLNQEKDKFFSIIAHDLRSPISSLMGITGMLAENMLNIPLPKLQNIFKEISDSANNLYQLMENLLQWAKIQQGLSPFKPEKVVLSKITDLSIAVHSEFARSKNIKMENTISKDLVVFADKNMLQFVIRNMVSNAIKFTNKGGMVTISARNISEKKLEIEIKDTGIGVDNELQEGLFKLNTQMNRQGTNGEPSSGLGLLLCKEYIEKNEGEIRVCSQVGKGTSFFIVLKREN